MPSHSRIGLLVLAAVLFGSAAADAQNGPLRRQALADLQLEPPLTHASVPLVVIPEPLIPDRPSLGPVLVVTFAALGTAAGLVVAVLPLAATDQGISPLLVPGALAGGAALGGMTGALLGGRRIAPVHTTLGAAVGALPALVMEASESRSLDWLGFPALRLPIIGVWFGNSLGQ